MFRRRFYFEQLAQPRRPIATAPAAVPVDLAAAGVVSTAELTSPACAQAHNFAPLGVIASAAVPSAALGQVHALASAEHTSAASVSVGVLGQSHAITASGIASAPTVSAPGAGQSHALSASGLSASGSVAASVVGQSHALTAQGLASGAIAGVAATGQTAALSASGVTASATVSLPGMGQSHALTATGAIASPAVHTSAVGQSHALAAPELRSDIIIGGTLLNADGSILIAGGVVSSASVASPALGQAHALSALGARSDAEVNRPSRIDAYDLVGVGVTSAPTVAFAGAVQSVTITEQVNLGGGAWRVSWISANPGAVFRIYQDGVLIETSARTSRVFHTLPGESLLVEILDDPDDQPMSAYPGRVALAWSHAAGAVSYLIYEYISGDWTYRATVADSGAGAYRWESRFLEDSTVHAFRVVPVSAYGNIGDPLNLSALMVRHPDAPTLALTYSPDTGAITID